MNEKTIANSEFLTQLKTDVENSDKDLKTSRLDEAIVRQENVFVILGEIRRLIRKTSGRELSDKIVEELTTNGYMYDDICQVGTDLFDL